MPASRLLAGSSELPFRRFAPFGSYAAESFSKLAAPGVVLGQRPRGRDRTCRMGIGYHFSQSRGTPSMKRLLLRMTLLSLVVGLGTVVVYEAQRRLHPPEETPGESPTAQASLDPQPIPLSVDSGTAGMADPNGYAGAPTCRHRLPSGRRQWARSRRLSIAGSSGAAGRTDRGLCPIAGERWRTLCRSRADSPRPRAEPAVGSSQPTAGEPIGGADPGAPAQFAAAHGRRGHAAGRQAADDWQDHFAPPSATAQGNYRATPCRRRRRRPPDDSVGQDDDAPPSGRGIGRPGERQLEGAQAPSLTIEKRAPSEIQVGKAAKFTTTVRNQGQVAAQGVEVRDLVPQGTELVGTTPQAEQGPQGELVWQLGTLKPGSETTVEMQLMPLAEGEVGSVATLHFEAGASVRTMATRPQVAIDVTAPPRVMIGTEVTLRIKISNPGSGAATGVVVTEVVPPNLTHPAGSELEFEIGTLKPGESRELELGLKAVRPGPVTNMLTARGDANLRGRRPGAVRSGGARVEGRHVGAEAPLSGADGGLHHLGFQSRHGAGQGYRPGGGAAQGTEIRRGQQRRSVRPGDRIGLLELGTIARGRKRHGDAWRRCRRSRANCICRSAHTPGEISPTRSTRPCSWRGLPQSCSKWST